MLTCLFVIVLSIIKFDTKIQWVSRVLKSQKSVWRDRQHFSCLLDEGIPKIWMKLNSHDGLFSYLQNSTANSAHLAAHFCPALVCPQKSTVRIQFLPYFWNSLIKYTWKFLSNPPNTFFGYFNTLETHIDNLTHTQT